MITGFENNHEKVAPIASTPIARKSAPVVEEKPQIASDDITDDELDELLGMLQKKDKKEETPAPGFKRYF